MPAQQCSDGSVGGNTGRCIRVAEGCGLEVRDCQHQPHNSCGFTQTAELTAGLANPPPM